ncbi:hypothetical protein [Bradyrhizobium acaciae]|uniref:hypothetical protein n=1 Tax=Bradyrhizobium acaciae TaxID=2683706 RepID=UPI001E4D2253|nr:hypothetical protein [Bradyrhizobium acaciae]MCC8981208.1 hypothetical protein [Bradyrhizobium acaciae]
MDCKSDSKIDFAGIAVAICVAACTAIMLACLAQDDLGLTATQTRKLAVMAALFLALPIVLDFLRTRPGDAR